MQTTARRHLRQRPAAAINRLRASSKRPTLPTSCSPRPSPMRTRSRARAMQCFRLAWQLNPRMCRARGVLRRAPRTRVRWMRQRRARQGGRRQVQSRSTAGATVLTVRQVRRRTMVATRTSSRPLRVQQTTAAPRRAPQARRRRAGPPRPQTGCRLRARRRWRRRGSARRRWPSLCTPQVLHPAAPHAVWLWLAFSCEIWHARPVQVFVWQWSCTSRAAQRALFGIDAR